MRTWIVAWFIFSHAAGFGLHINRHFTDVKEEARKRWKAFQEGKKFVPFKPGRSDKELEDEFEELCKIRKDVWMLPEYGVAEHLIYNGHVRYESLTAFHYNNSASYYNASTIFLEDRPYIALQGPRSRDVRRFFKLLKSMHVTHLVRLTDAYEGKREKCSPYWEGILDEEHLHIPHKGDTYRVRAFDIAEWPDNNGVDPKRLLEVVLEVREDLKKTEGLLAVHCSAGVGRTGTFLAAMAIIEIMDKKKTLSIEEIVYRLSLQRIASVSTANQYSTLYRLAELYEAKAF